MRISDWSSDVCSSDLFEAAAQTRALPIPVSLFRLRLDPHAGGCDIEPCDILILPGAGFHQVQAGAPVGQARVENKQAKSEERQVGKEWVRPGRSRGMPVQ